MSVHCKYVIRAVFRAERRKLVPHWPSDSANGGGVTKPRHTIPRGFSLSLSLSLSFVSARAGLETRIKIHRTREKFPYRRRSAIGAPDDRALLHWRSPCRASVLRMKNLPWVLRPASAVSMGKIFEKRHLKSHCL